MNDKLTQRPEPSKSIEAMKAACLLVQGEDWPVANVTLDRAVVSGAVNEYRALQAYIDTLEAKLSDLEVQALGHAIDARMLADKREAKQAPVDKEGWLERQTIEQWVEACLADDENGFPCDWTDLLKLCRMALYALNGPPAVDWMPIDSAPKDGCVDLWHKDGFRVCGVDALDLRLRVVNVDCGNYDTESYNSADFTHWLPLPPAPTDHKGGKL